MLIGDNLLFDLKEKADATAAATTANDDDGVTTAATATALPLPQKK